MIVVYLAGLVLLPAVVLSLVAMSGGNWRAIAITLAYSWLPLYTLAACPPLLWSLLRLSFRYMQHREAILETKARYLADMMSIEARKQVDLASGRHYHELQDVHDRQIALRATNVDEALPVVDQLEDFVVGCLIDAYREAEPDGRLPAGIISKSRTKEAGFTESQHLEVMARLQESGVARFEKQRWYLNVDTVPSIERAFELITGRRWMGAS